MTTRPAPLEEKVAVGVPGLSPERAVTWPKQTKTRLSNGLEVVLAEAHSIPKFCLKFFSTLFYFSFCPNSIFKLMNQSIQTVTNEVHVKLVVAWFLEFEPI